jgi:transcription antitermination factor NusG
MSDQPNKPGGIVPGQRIRIVGGTFEKFVATVEWIDAETGIVHAGINIFGVVTPVELEPGDCEPIES